MVFKHSRFTLSVERPVREPQIRSRRRRWDFALWFHPWFGLFDNRGSQGLQNVCKNQSCIKDLDTREESVSRARQTGGSLTPVTSWHTHTYSKIFFKFPCMFSKFLYCILVLMWTVLYLLLVYWLTKQYTARWLIRWGSGLPFFFHLGTCWQYSWVTLLNNVYIW